jgi:hypothetical protein
MDFYPIFSTQKKKKKKKKKLVLNEEEVVYVKAIRKSPPEV